MIATIPEKKKLVTQRRIRRLRQQRLLAGISLLLNEDEVAHTNGVSEAGANTHQITELGWTPADALAAYYRFQSFAEDWNAPGMELYDAL